MTIVVRPARVLSGAQRILDEELAAVDRACSRFRPDSEIRTLDRAGGLAVPVSALLFDLVVAACDAAERTGGAVDPTVGSCLDALGYDRDFAELEANLPARTATALAAVGWWTVAIDHGRRAVGVPSGVCLDLGATAKAAAADRIAARVATELGAGVLVVLGGDVSVAGPPPPGGWPVGIAPDSSLPASKVDSVVAMTSGGIATSSTDVRTWRYGGDVVHHIVDPATGKSASRYWRTVSVAAATCLDANTASTAAVVWGEDAPDRLEALDLPGRLVRHDGIVRTIAGWPADNRDRGAPHRRAPGAGRPFRLERRP